MKLTASEKAIVALARALILMGATTVDAWKKAATKVSQE